MGHLDADRLINLARARFYWPYLQKGITQYISAKCRCLKQRAPTLRTRAHLQPITNTAPFQVVPLHFVLSEKGSGGYEYILVIMDHFTPYALAYATRDKSARTMAEKLCNDLTLHFEFPEKLLHD